MAIEQRLPVVGGDDGIWGDDLNTFLGKEHYNADTTLTPGTSTNGGHKTITIRAGTTAASTAPLKLKSGPLMTTPEVGAVEFLTDRLYFTQTTATTRKVIAAYDDSAGASGDVYYRNSLGYFVRLPIGANTNVLTVSGGLPIWTVAPGAAAGLSQPQVMAIRSLRV